jgi:hypothetical protein
VRRSSSFLMEWRVVRASIGASALPPSPSPSPSLAALAGEGVFLESWTISERRAQYRLRRGTTINGRLLRGNTVSALWAKTRLTPEATMFRRAARASTGRSRIRRLLLGGLRLGAIESQRGRARRAVTYFRALAARVMTESVPWRMSSTVRCAWMAGTLPLPSMIRPFRPQV